MKNYPNRIFVVRKVPDMCGCEYKHYATHWANGEYRFPPEFRNISCLHGRLGSVVRYELENGEEFKSNEL